MALPKNIGERDRTIRLVASAVLILLSFFVSAVALQILLTIVALVLLYTSWSRTCFAYIPLDINTREDNAG